MPAMPNAPSERGSNAPPVAADDVPYGRYYYRYYSHDAETPYERTDDWLAFFDHIAERLTRELRPATALDAGCAMGFLVEKLVGRGVDAWGVDISEYAISQAHESVADRCWVGSLTEPLPRRYELITCIETIEHLDPDEGAKALANLCDATDRMLFSSTPDDYAEPTHLNVRPPEAWSADMAVHGFYRNLDYDASYLSPWAVLYERRKASIPDVVRAYDRVYYALRKETKEVRAALLGVQQRLEDAENLAGQVDVDQLEAELLQARDELLHLEMEASRLRGENTELQSRVAASAPAADILDSVLSSRYWRARQKVAGPYHKLLAGMRRATGS